MTRKTVPPAVAPPGPSKAAIMAALDTYAKLVAPRISPDGRELRHRTLTLDEVRVIVHAAYAIDRVSPAVAAPPEDIPEHGSPEQLRRLTNIIRKANEP